MTGGKATLGRYSQFRHLISRKFLRKQGRQLRSRGAVNENIGPTGESRFLRRTAAKHSDVMKSTRHALLPFTIGHRVVVHETAESLTILVVNMVPRSCRHALRGGWRKNGPSC